MRVQAQAASVAVVEDGRGRSLSGAAAEASPHRLGRPLYWAGQRRGTTYELTQTPDGRVYVRYLPHGVQVGSGRPYLTVGTYPVANAYATTKAAASKPGAVPIRISGGIAFYDKSRPTSVYLAFPGVDEQIEVYDPSAATVHRDVADRLISTVSS